MALLRTTQYLHRQYPSPTHLSDNPFSVCLTPLSDLPDWGPLTLIFRLFECMRKLSTVNCYTATSPKPQLARDQPLLMASLTFSSQALWNLPSQLLALLKPFSWCCQKHTVICTVWFLGSPAGKYNLGLAVVIFSGLIIQTSGCFSTQTTRTTCKGRPGARWFLVGTTKLSHGLENN